MLRDRDKLRAVKLPRCIMPREGHFKEPILMVFGDGSKEASCYLFYIRWEREDEHVLCRLVIGKSPVAPRVKITIPRMIALVAAVNGVRLAMRVRESTKMSRGRVKYLTKS